MQWLSRPLYTRKVAGSNPAGNKWFMVLYETITCYPTLGSSENFEPKSADKNRCRIVQWSHDSRLLLLLNWFLHIIKRTLHVARRYEFYVLVAKTISHSFAALTSQILFLSLKHKIVIFSPPCNIFYVLFLEKNAEYLTTDPHGFTVRGRDCFHYVYWSLTQWV